MSKSSEEWWASYAEMRKVAAIIRDILGWECFTSWESYQHKYGMQEWGYIAGEKFTTPTPVAFYDSEWRVWSPDHEKLDVFDPLHNLNDAWQVVRAINKPVDGSHERYARFIDALEKAVGSNMFFDLFYCDKDGDHLKPTRICDAALWAIEPEKQDAEVPDPGAIDTYIDGLKQVQRLAEVIEEQREQP